MVANTRPNRGLARNRPKFHENFHRIHDGRGERRLKEYFEYARRKTPRGALPQNPPKALSILVDMMQNSPKSMGTKKLRGAPWALKLRHKSRHFKVPNTDPLSNL